MKYKDPDDVDFLTEEIFFAQMENFATNFNRAMKKDITNDLKRALILITPFITGVITLVLNSNPILDAFCPFIMTSGFIINITLPFVKRKIKAFKKGSENVFTLHEQKEEQTVEEILAKGIGKEKDSNFYTDKTKKAIREIKNETPEEKKYYEVLEEIKFNQSHRGLYVYKGSEEKNYLDKNESIAQITNEIDTYYLIYNIPSTKITGVEWDNFFTILYDFFLQKNAQNYYYEILSKICRITLAKVIVSKCWKKITIKNFIDNLCYLEDFFINYDVKISKKEILELQEKLSLEVYSEKVIIFNNTRIKKK